MALTLYLHPLASFCHKVLIPLYQNGTLFTPVTVDLSDPVQAEHLRSIWAVGKFPVLRDDTRGQTVPETSIIIDYLDRNYPGPVPMIPADPDAALEARLWDRFFDLYIHDPMQRIVADVLRPADHRDPHGVKEARDKLQMAYAMLEERMADRAWAAGDAFSIADCAASPALFYALIIEPFAGPNTTAYFERLLARPAFARVLEEAKPYFQYFPFRNLMPQRFL